MKSVSTKRDAGHLELTGPKPDPINRDPEVFARAVLGAAGYSRPPVGVSDCVRVVRGLALVEEGLTKDGYLIDFGDGFAEILVSKNAARERARYTAAHEMGHWILRRETVDSRRAEDFAAKPEVVERWCNRFAASLLMPTEWIRAYVGQAKNLANDRVIVHGPGRFRVSRESFYTRLAEIFRVAIVSCTIEGLEASVVLWPSSALGTESARILPFVQRRYWSSLRSRRAQIKGVAFARIPDLGSSVVVTGGIEPADAPPTVPVAK